MAHLSPTAAVLMKAASVAYPEAVTIEPKTELVGVALQELRDNEFIYAWDMWSNGDRRWMATPAGLAAVSNGERTPQ